MNNALGLYIPNSDYSFECSFVKCINDYMFVVTKSNEIITYKNEEDSVKGINLKKKFILLTHPQSREVIFDIFIINKSPTLLDLSNFVIVTITKNLIFHFWDIKDGLCINKLNLSNYKSREDTLLKAFTINDRSILILHLNGLVIVEEENLGFEINKIYNIKENKLFLLSTTNETYFLEIKNINPRNENNGIQDICTEFSYRLYKHTFNINKIFKEDTLHSLISNQDFIFYNFNQQLGVSFLDSVEELSELASLNTEHKSKIYYLGKIERSEEELLVVIYKDLWCETFTYDKIHRDIKRKEKFAIMIEDEYFNLKFTVLDQYLVGYVDSQIFIFDIRKFMLKGEKYVDRTIELQNIYDRNKKDIFFTNYFKDNFESYHRNLMANLQTSNIKLVRDYQKEKEEDNSLNNKTQSIKITASAFLCDHQNDSIYYVIGTSNGKVAIIDIFFDENLNLSPVIIMDYHTKAITFLQIYENRLLIAASVDGMITFTDVSKEQISTVMKRKDSKNRKSSKIFGKNDINGNIFEQSLTSKKSFEVSSNLNYYYSKKKSLIGKDISNMMVLDEETNNDSNKSFEEKLRIMNLLPIQTYKNYYKLKRIIYITQLDNLSLNLDENFKPIKKKYLGFELENNSVLVIDMKTLKIIYNYNIYSEKNDITAIYHIESQKCLIFYQDNNIIKIVNYVTKTADRIVTDLTKIYSILRVEEKLKMYFRSDSEEYITNDFKARYHRPKEEKKESESTRELNNRLLNSTMRATITYSPISDNNTKHSDLKLGSESNLSLEFITQVLKTPNEKKIFIQKYLHNVYNIRKIHMNVTYSKFESVWLNKLESYIIDELFSIVNSNWMSDLIKKIKIMNLLYNPLNHYKLYNRFEYETQGVELNTIKLGNQLNEYLSLNLEDFCLYIEKMVNKRSDLNLKRKNNFYNFVSLFRIWNLSIDQDLNIFNFLRIYQPIFEFNYILRGYDCSLSLLLNEEPETRDSFNGHFNFFNSYINANEDTKKIMKEERFCNKKYIINRQQGFLVNFKNFVVSSNLSHLMNLIFFSVLTAALGFQESIDLCKVMSSEKLLLRSLSQQNFISFTNMAVINKFMYDYIDSVTIANKDIILVDYLFQKYSSFIDHKTKDVTENHFINSINMIRTYLNMVYAYLFDLGNLQDIFVNFYKFSKEKNLENQKLVAISEFELSLINILIMYNSIAEAKDKLDEQLMTKITHLLILFAFKILNPSFSHFLKPNYSKTVVELLSNSTEILDKIYKDNYSSYAKFLIDFYSSIKIPIDLEGLFKKYEIGNCVVIKSENNLNFLKIMVAKLLKNYSKIHINSILKIILEEFKKKTQEYEYFSNLLEILWIIFREKNSKHVNFLPPLINLIINAMSPQNKEMKTLCLENAKKVLSCLLPNYPMISFHQNRQRLSVGANDGKIFIYDLASCTLWKNLNAHTNEITALTFDFSGNILISYSSSEATVKFWKIGLTNFFSNFFSMKDGYYKSEKLKVIESEIKNEDKVNVVKFQLMPKNDNKVVLIREDKSVEVLSL